MRPAAFPASRSSSPVRARDLVVVLVSYNTCGLLATSLAAFRDALAPWDAAVIVVDNASRDGSAELVATRFPEVHLIRNERNRGFAAAVNQALRASESPYVLLFNPDARPTRAAIGALLRFLASRPRAAACGPQLLERDGTPQPPTVHFPTPLSGLFAATRLRKLFPRSRHLVRPQLPPHTLRQPLRVGWISGACFLVRREAIRDVGPMDEGFFLYFEETDWCRRFHRAGWEIWYLPDVTVEHLGGASVGVHGGPFGTYHPQHMLRSRRRYMRRYYGLAGMLLCEGLDALLFAVDGLQAGLRGDRAARRDAWRGLAAVLNLRRLA